MKKATLWRIGVVVAAIAAIEAACRFGYIKRATMIAPSDMADNLWRILLSGRFNDDIWSTLSNVAIAFVLCVVLGFAAGVVIHALPRFRRTIDPLVASWYAIPFFVFYPIMIVVFGMNALPIIAIGFMFGVVGMIVNTLNGLDRVPPVLIKVAHMHRMGPVALALRIKLPAAMPWLSTGIKLSVAYAFIGVIASEFILSGSGLGYTISYAYNNFDNRTMYALMLFVLVLVSGVNGVLHVWEQRMIARRGGR